MINKTEIFSFLESQGFSITQKDSSEYFGDYFTIFSNTIIDIQYSSSKSFETVDVRMCMETDRYWFDLALVKALLYNEKDLNKITTIEEHNEFLRNNLDEINKLFSPSNYISTKNKLDELSNIRARQMFPGMI